jgi:hypothetical protein
VKLGADGAQGRGHGHDAAVGGGRNFDILETVL